MNPINIICPGCGIDMLIEPEVEEDEEATCGMCGAYLWPTIVCERHGIKGDYE